MKKFNPFIQPIIQPSKKGKWFEFDLNKITQKCLNEADEVDKISKEIERYNKANFSNNPDYLFPKEARRLTEQFHPHEKRNRIRKNQKRSRDKAIVINFCNMFMWSQAYHVPKK